MAESHPELHRRYPELAATLPHLRLGSRPRPLTRLDGIGVRNRVWCKDDSGFGDGGWGGNKVRKLEWILPDVEAHRSHRILTVGALGTNWGLATALYARDRGIDTTLALIDQPVDEHVRAQLVRLHESGATVHRTHTKARTIALAPWLFARHGFPYYLPAGGSTPIGTLGYVEAALELAEQVRSGEMPEPAAVVTAVGSGGTAAGLLLGLRLAGLRTRVVAVVVNDTLPLAERDLVGLARGTERLLRSRGARFGPVDLGSGSLIVTRRWLGPGYGHPTAEGTAAARVAADAGLTLDPVYTAKAFAGLLALDEHPMFGDAPIVFVDTYGPR
ncbi:1-aminocyclopropane-1-carboxylate deaminase/D-cysteine desulfhydrase [Rhodococcus gannanensis]|uniref:1-aminocyclopropane-1-carboxylate deaminase/D-cysteine desulfhydrase n=1 Tax=Rhodococcus gannanensis TaxID=1960308 RepID=A0ABW4PC88_9NOCA